MAGTIKCEIVTPVKQVYEADAAFAAVPGISGEIGVLDMHAPTISTLGEGEVRVTPEEGAEPVHFAISGGYVEIDGKKVIVLANRAEKVADIDAAAVEAKVAEFEAALSAMAEDDSKRAYAKQELDWNHLLQKLSA